MSTEHYVNEKREKAKRQKHTTRTRQQLMLLDETFCFVFSLSLCPLDVFLFVCFLTCINFKSNANFKKLKSSIT